MLVGVYLDKGMVSDTPESAENMISETPQYTFNVSSVAPSSSQEEHLLSEGVFSW